MAIATEVSIGTSQKVSVDFQSQEVSVRVTYALESQDGDLLTFVAQKAQEVEKAHAAIWRRIREQRTHAQRSHACGEEPQTAENRAEASPESPSPPEPSKGSASPSEKSGCEAPAALHSAPQVQEEEATAAQVRAIRSLASRARMTETALQDMLLRRYGKRSVEQLSKQQAAALLMRMQRGEGSPPALAATAE